MIAAHQTMLAPQGGAAAQRCAVFDGASYAKGSAGYWNTASQGSISFSSWIRITSVPASGTCFGMALQNSTANTGPSLDPIYNATRKFRCMFQNVKAYTTSSEIGVVGEWHHYAFSYNKDTGAFGGYFDGTKVLSGTQNRWLNTSNNLFACLSTNGTGNGGYLIGRMANANIYLRALSDTDVSALAAGVGTIPTDADHQWIFANDDFSDTGTAVTKWDLTGYGNPTFEDV